MGDNDFPAVMYKDLLYRPEQDRSRLETLPFYGEQAGVEKLPYRPNERGIGFLQEYLRGFSDYSQAGTDIPSLRMQEKYGQERGGPLVSEMMITGSPSFEINKSQGALGRRSGEQLLRLQEGSGAMQNQQLQREMARRGILPRGIQLPPV